jgi:hypothetical protein
MNVVLWLRSLGFGNYEESSMRKMRRGGSSDRAPENPTATLSAFRRSLANNEPPVGLMPALAALWWAGKDDWDKA